MDNKQAIKIIETEKKCVCRQFEKGCDRLCRKCDLVLEDKEIINAYDMAINLLQAEPCDDAISRQEVLSCYQAMRDMGDLGKVKDVVLVDNIKMLPPVLPKAKVGKWYRVNNGDYESPCYATECSECGEQFEDFWDFPYCPNCGVKMESEE